MSALRFEHWNFNRSWLLKSGISMSLWLHACCMPCDAASPSNKSEFSAFQEIVSSNIFNAKRSPSYVPSDQPDQRRESQIDFLTLTGTLIDENGPRAFFYGNKSEYQKVVKPEDKIADFKVAAVDYTTVLLKSETNETKIPVGMQLSRKEGGTWHLGARTDTADSSPPVASSNDRDRSDRRDYRRGDRGDRGSDRRNSFGRRDNGSSSDTSSFPNGGPAQDLIRTDPALSGAGTNNGSSPTPAETRPSGRTETPEETLQRLARQREEQDKKQ
jgi:hypothetical protein